MYLSPGCQEVSICPLGFIALNPPPNGLLCPFFQELKRHLSFPSEHHGVRVTCSCQWPRVRALLMVVRSLLFPEDCSFLWREKSWRFLTWWIIGRRKKFLRPERTWMSLTVTGGVSALRLARCCIQVFYIRFSKTQKQSFEQGQHCDLALPHRALRL